MIKKIILIISCLSPMLAFSDFPKNNEQEEHQNRVLSLESSHNNVEKSSKDFQKSGVPYSVRFTQGGAMAAVLFYNGVSILKSFKLTKYAVTSLGGLGFRILRKMSIPFVFSLQLAKANYEHNLEDFLQDIKYQGLGSEKMKQFCSESPYLPFIGSVFILLWVGKKIWSQKETIRHYLCKLKDDVYAKMILEKQKFQKMTFRIENEIKAISDEQDTTKLIKKILPKDLKTTLFLLHKIGWI